MMTHEKLLEARELFNQEMALRDKALDALEEYNKGGCKDEKLWNLYLELESQAEEKEKEYKKFIREAES